MENELKFKENLRYLRKANNMSQDELAAILGYKSFTTVQKWEDGTAFPVVENLNKIAGLFNVDLNHLLNKDLRTSQVKVPVLGEVKAGYDLYANEDIVSYEYMNSEEYKPGEYFYLKVKGDSMVNDHIYDSSLVYVKKQDYLKDNEIGVFLLDNDEVTIKRIKYNKDLITLKAANPKYKDKSFKENDIKILGKVLHCKVML